MLTQKSMYQFFIFLCHSLDKSLFVVETGIERVDSDSLFDQLLLQRLEFCKLFLSLSLNMGERAIVDGDLDLD